MVGGQLTGVSLQYNLIVSTVYPSVTQLKQALKRLHQACMHSLVFTKEGLVVLLELA